MIGVELACRFGTVLRMQVTTIRWRLIGTRPGRCG
jgi:hypothetical protein